LNKFLHHFILNRCNEFDSKIWLVTSSRAYTFKEIQNRAINASEALRSRGVHKGDYLALQFDDKIEFIVMIFAVLLAEAIPVPFHSSFPTKLCRDLSERNGISYLLSSSSIDFICSNDEKEQADHSVNDVAICFPTSGTSSFPKIVQLSHANILENMKAIAVYFPLGSDDLILLAKSLAHASTFTGEVLLSLFCGSRLFIPEEGYSPRKLADVIDRNEITTLIGVTTMYRQMHYLLNRKFHSVRYVKILGEPVTEPDVRKVKELFPEAQLFVAYGLTEAGPRVSALLPNEQKPGSVGRPVDKTRIEVFDANNQSCSTGVPGVVVVSGVGVMKGYLNNPEGTARRLKEGRLWTDDVGYLDEDGYLYILGRRDDVFFRGGENIYPVKIEAVIKQLEGVRQVLVVNEKDLIRGEKIRVLVELNDKEMQTSHIYQFCIKHLCSYEIPDFIEIVEHIPQNAAGKLIRKRGECTNDNP